MRTSKVTIGELEEDFEDLISEVESGKTYVVVDEDDEPLAVIVPYSTYEDYIDLIDE